jgi:hypothetical protein
MAKLVALSPCRLAEAAMSTFSSNDSRDVLLLGVQRWLPFLSLLARDDAGACVA